MSDKRAPGDTSPATSDQGQSRRSKTAGGRDERLAAALRANLARRKAQGRVRSAGAADDSQGAAENAANETREE